MSGRRIEKGGPFEVTHTAACSHKLDRIPFAISFLHNHSLCISCFYKYVNPLCLCKVEREESGAEKGEADRCLPALGSDAFHVRMAVELAVPELGCQSMPAVAASHFGCEGAGVEEERRK